jgi:hypothetical protein
MCIRLFQVIIKLELFIRVDESVFAAIEPVGEIGIFLALFFDFIFFYFCTSPFLLTKFVEKIFFTKAVFIQ